MDIFDMNIQLYNQLKQAYTEVNLNRISSKVIDLFKKRDFSRINTLKESIEDIIDFNDETPKKVFSKLMTLYHPDKLIYYKNKLETHYQAAEFEKLELYSHILTILIELDNFSASNSDIEVDFEVYWSYDEADFDSFEDIYADLFSDEQNEDADEEPGYDEVFDDYIHEFFIALKLKEYGNLDIRLHPHHLEDLEGHLELANFGINDLSGLEHCVNLTSLDLSSNHIISITKLSYLSLLEEVDLSYNGIYDLVSLTELTNLRTINLANNDIEDISPLFELDHLKYLDVTNNSIPAHQINTLIEKGVNVDYDKEDAAAKKRSSKAKKADSSINDKGANITLIK